MSKLPAIVTFLCLFALGCNKHAEAPQPSAKATTPDNSEPIPVQLHGRWKIISGEQSTNFFWMNYTNQGHWLSAMPQNALSSWDTVTLQPDTPFRFFGITYITIDTTGTIVFSGPATDSCKGIAGYEKGNLLFSMQQIGYLAPRKRTLHPELVKANVAMIGNNRMELTTTRFVYEILESEGPCERGLDYLVAARLHLTLERE
jgi:hypothetical protein